MGVREWSGPGFFGIAFGYHFGNFLAGLPRRRLDSFLFYVFTLPGIALVEALGVLFFFGSDVGQVREIAFLATRMDAAQRRGKKKSIVYGGAIS